jgi:predicted metal-dependent peptidase
VSVAAVSQTITRARLQLMLGQPYLAGAIARLPLVDASDSPWCATAATDGYCIFINPAWLEQLAEDEIATVLAHETLHCLLGHLDRRGNREPRLWNIAIDYATNGLLVASGMTLPTTGLHDRSLDGMTAEDIYDTLLQTGGADGLPTLAGPGGQNQGGGWDLHVDPSDVCGALHRPKDFPTALERARLRAELSAELKGRIAGKQAGYFSAELQAMQSRQVAWEAILARFISGLRRSDYRLFPPNRKHLWRGLYLPGVGVPGPQHLVLAIDTSGSMSDELLRSIIGEIDQLRSVSECRLTVLQCDTRICHEVSFESFEPADGIEGKVRLLGRGGTDLRPPFQWVESRIADGEPVDALIYFTDGYGSAPAQEPGFDILWVIPSTGRVPAEWGAVLEIKDPRP